VNVLEDKGPTDQEVKDKEKKGEEKENLLKLNHIKCPLKQTWTFVFTHVTTTPNGTEHFYYPQWRLFLLLLLW